MEVDSIDAGKIILSNLEVADEVDEYTLTNIHFHSGSEHLLSDERLDMELHLVHQIVDPRESKNDYLVLAVLFHCEAVLNNVFLTNLHIQTLEVKYYPFLFMA